MPPVGPAVSQTCHKGSARQPVCGLDGQSVITSDPAKVTNPCLSWLMTGQNNLPIFEPLYSSPIPAHAHTHAHMYALKNTQWPHWRVPGCRRDSIYEKTSRLHSVCLFAFVITVWQPLLPSPSSHPPMPQSKYNFIRFFICSYPVQTQSRSGSFDFRLKGGNWALHIDLIPRRRHPFLSLTLLEASKVRPQSQKYRICCSLGSGPTTCQSFCSFFIWLITWL